MELGKRVIETVRDIDRIERQSLNLLSNYLEFSFDGDQLSYHLKEAQRIISENAPFAACPCNGIERQCPKCEGKKWLTASQCRQLSSQEPKGSSLAWLLTPQRHETFLEKEG